MTNTHSPKLSDAAAQKVTEHSNLEPHRPPLTHEPVQHDIPAARPPAPIADAKPRGPIPDALPREGIGTGHGVDG